MVLNQTNESRGMSKPVIYKSEVFIPIRQDVQSFEERQRPIWEEMQTRMERRRQEWEEEVNQMRKDFFRLKPSETRRGSSDNLLESRDLDNIFYDDVAQGQKTFRVSFDVKQFKPNEINVRTQDQKLLVNAVHEEASGARKESRQFSRSLDIPKHVDPATLTCTLSNDGILQVEAPVSTPAYDMIRDSAQGATTRLQAGPPQSSLQSGSLVTEQDGSRTFKIAVDVGVDYEPQDITVKTVDQKLVIRARHEEKLPGRSSVREFNKEFGLPENVDPNTVTASFTDGKLLLEAPIASYSQGAYQGKPGATKQPKVFISMQK